jgi:hypothetical protein
MGTRGSFPGVKRPGRVADHSPPSTAEVKEWVELYLHSPDMPSWRGAQLKKKHRDNFTFTLSRVLLQKLTVTQLVKKFPDFDGTGSFITLFTRVRHWSLSWARWIQSTSSRKFHSNIILPSTPRSSEWSLSFRFPGKTYI